MALTSFLRRFTTTRRFLRAIDRIAFAEEQQLLLLQRLADRWAPLPPTVNAADLKTTSVTFSRDEEQGRIQDFVDRCWQDLKREPTEEEICDFLDGVPLRLH